MKSVAKKREPRFQLVVEFSNRELDSLVEKAVGRISDSSGYSLMTGRRDMEWWYHYHSAAQRAMQRVKDLRKRISVEVVEHDYPWGN